MRHFSGENLFGVWGFLAILPAALGGILLMMAIYPLILKIRKKIGNYKTMIMFQVIHFIGFLGFFFVTDYWLMVIFYVLILTAFSGTGIANALANTDIIDADMISTGERRAPMFKGIGGLFLHPVSGIAVLLFTSILDITGYNATPGAVQSPAALFGIRFAMGAIPMIFIAIATVIWCFFPFHGKYYEEMRGIVEKRFEATLERRGEAPREEILTYS